MATTTPVGVTNAKGTGNTLDGDGIGSSNDRKKLLTATKRTVALGETSSTVGSRLAKGVANLDTLVFIARKVATKGK